MKKLLLNLLKKTLSITAVCCAATPSFVSMYCPECPEQLKKHKI